MLALRQVCPYREQYDALARQDVGSSISKFGGYDFDEAFSLNIRL